MNGRTADRIRADWIALNEKLDGVRHPECHPRYRALVAERRLLKEELHQALQRESRTP